MWNTGRDSLEPPKVTDRKILLNEVGDHLMFGLSEPMSSDNATSIPVWLIALSGSLVIVTRDLWSAGVVPLRR